MGVVECNAFLMSLIISHCSSVIFQFPFYLEMEIKLEDQVR